MFIEENVSKENREGVLKWYAKGDVFPFLSYADQMILRLENESVVVSEIRDDVNKQNIFRTLIKGEQPEIITYINGQKVYCNSSRFDDLQINSILMKK